MQNQKKHENPLSNEQGFCLLIVEDNKDFAFTLERDLLTQEKFKFRVKKASSLTEALKMTQEVHPDCIILDLSLPEAFGQEVFMTFHKTYPNLAIVVLTGLEDEKLSIELIHQGAQDYLVKGDFNSDTLMRSILYAIERKKDQLEMERLASFPERNPEPIIEWDAQGNMSYFNLSADIFLKTLGPNGSKDLRSTWVDMVRISHQGKEVFDVEFSFEGRTYQLHTYALSGRKLFRIYVMEITKSKQMEKMKEEFIHHVNHEMRSPLSTIQNALSMIRDSQFGNINKEQEKILGVAQNSVNQLSHMVSDLLECTRLEIGKLAINLRRHRIEQVADEVVNALSASAKSKSIFLSLHCQEDLPYVLIDPVRCRQILTNLVENSLKFTPKDGEIKISIYKLEDPNELQVIVKDTGAGIEKIELEHIFERLYQINEAEKYKKKGLGLGLYITKKLVETQGGKIWADSTLGQGSSFNFTIPCFSLKQIFINPILKAPERMNQVQIIKVHLTSEKSHAMTDNFFRTLMAHVKEEVKQTISGADIILPEFQNETLQGIIFILLWTNETGAKIVSGRIEKTIQNIRELKLHYLSPILKVLPVPFLKEGKDINLDLNSLSQELEKILFREISQAQDQSLNSQDLTT